MVVPHQGPPQPDAATGGKRICSERARPWILTVAILVSALGFIDGTIVSIAMPAIRESLGASLVQAQWVSNAYLLTLSALILAAGAASDRFGLVRVLVVGVSVFVLASLVCAAAWSAELLIAARLVQGIGAALMIPGSLALIARSYPPETRGRAIGIWAAASAITTALGPLLGGLLLTAAGAETWRLLFAVNIPLGALALWLLLTRTERDTPAEDAPIDVAGVVTAVAALFLVAWALTGQESGSNAEGNAWLAGLFGLALFGVFILVEARSRHPMMPLGLFRTRIFSVANLVTFGIYFALSAVLFFLPMTIISGWGRSEIEASLVFVPLTIAIAVLSQPVGALSDRIGPGWPIIAGAALVSLSFLGLAVAVPQTAFWSGVVPAMALMGIGMGFVVAPLSTAIMGSVGADKTGIASAINNAVARIAGLVAVAAMGSFIAIRYSAAGGPAAFAAASAAGDAHLTAMNTAFRDVALVVAVMSAASAVITLATLRSGGQDTVAR
ncbi:MAG: MFS transporter [Pseudomonadota bacterium]